MTCGVLEAPRVPRPAPADWTASRARAWRTALAVAVLALTTAEGVRAQPGGRLPEGTITEVRIEGNASIPAEQIRAKIKSRAGSPLDQRLIEADLKSLLGTKWFSDVSPYLRRRPQGGKGYILIFAVKEMPVLSHVEFLGRSGVKLKEIEETTGLKKGARADAMRARLAVEQILTLYHEKGYDLAEVKLVEGGKHGDTRVVIQHLRGAQAQGRRDRLRGEHVRQRRDARDQDHEPEPPASASSAASTTATTSRRTPASSATITRGTASSTSRSRRSPGPAPSLGDVRLTFVISEGIQYKVRKLVFEGNKKIPTAKLLEGLTLHSGQPFRDTMRDADRKTLISKYYSIGCIDTQILPEPKVTDEVGVVDLVYKIEEGEPYLLGVLDVRGNERTRDKVIRREAVMAGLLPGEVLDLNRIETFRKRLDGLQYFNAPPQQGGKPIEIKMINRRPHDKPYGDGAAPDLGWPVADPDAGPRPRASPGAPGRPAAGAGARRPGTRARARGAGTVRIGGRVRPAPRYLAADPGPRPPADGPSSGHRRAAAGAADASRRRGRAAGHVPEHPRHEHDRRRPRPPGAVPEPLVRRHRHVGR